MKKILKYSLVVSLCAAMVSLTGCQKKELATDPLKEAFSLAGIAPNPVMRGGALNIYGRGLDQVAEVHFAGENISVSEFVKLSKGTKLDTLQVLVPLEGPEVGKVSIVTADGRSLVSMTDLSFTEPIGIEKISPLAVVSRDVITITGEYLNVVKEVIFSGENAVVTEFESQSRHELKVKVPASAVDGPIILSDVNELVDQSTIPNHVYSSQELVLGQPTVKKAAKATYKVGDKITVTGSHLDMIKTVNLPGAEALAFTYTVANGSTEAIDFVFPATATPGNISLVSYEGEAFDAGEYEVVKPTKVVAAPQPVKAGEKLTITGKDLDLVSKINLENAAEVEFSYSEEEITLTVPAVAQEGDATLVMANSDEVSVAYTLVHPTVTGITPLTLTAGETFTVSGTDLDLITAITLGGKPVEFELDASKNIVVTTAPSSVPGKVVLTLANGETITADDQIDLHYDSLIIISSMPQEEHIGGIVNLVGENFMLIENIFIGEEKVTKYAMRSDTQIQFFMPWNKVGTYEMKFALLNGDVETCPSPIGVLLEQEFTTVWEGNLQITWNDGGRVMIPASKFEGVRPGSKLRFYYTQVENQWDQAQLNYGDWTTINFNGASGAQLNGTLVPTDLYGWFTDGILDRCTEVELTKEILDNIEAKKGSSEGVSNLGIIIQGSGLTFTKVEIVGEIPQEVTIYKGPTMMTWGDDGRFGLALKYFEDAGPGAKLIIYCEQTENWGQVQINDGSWGNGDVSFPELGGAYLTTDNAGGKDVTRIVLTITETLLEHLKTHAGDYFGLNTQYQGDGRVAFVLQGSDWIINEITLL